MPWRSPQAGSSRRLAVGIAELAPALVAVHDLAADEPRIAEQLVGVLDTVRPPARRGSRRRRSRWPSTSTAGTTSTVKCRRAPSAASSSGVPARLRPNRKSKPTAAPAIPSRCSRTSLMKSSGAGSASAASNFSTIAPSRPVAANRRSLARVVGETEQRLVRPEERARMRLEGQRRGRPAERLRTRLRRRDHGAVAAMHAVEIADRDHGAARAPAGSARRPGTAAKVGFGGGLSVMVAVGRAALQDGAVIAGGGRQGRTNRTSAPPPCVNSQP